MMMSLTTNGSSRGAILYNTTCTTHNTHPITNRHVTIPTRTSHIVSAKKLSSRTGRFDSKNKKTTSKEEEERSTAEIESSSSSNGSLMDGGGGGVLVNSEGKVMPVLEGLEKSFWEGPQLDAFGFFVQYMWAFGVMFALVACGVAVATYNDGATDFKETPAYKESIQSGDLLEGPESSTSDIFETNPTDVAPSLE